MKPAAKGMIEAGYPFLGTPYTKLDCQAFVEECLRGIGAYKNLAGSNAWYREIMRNGWVGTPEECKTKFGQIPPGAFLFILKASGDEPEKYKGDGIGNVSHIGLYTNKKASEMIASEAYKIKDEKERKDFIKKVSFGDGALHSSQSKGCVCTSKFAGKTINGGWNRIGLWNALDYGETINNILAGKTKKDDTPEKEVVIVLEYAKVRVTTGSTLNLRAAKSTKSDRITVIPNGATVAVTEHNDDWCKIAYNDYTGYVMTAYLSFDASDDGSDNKTSKIMLSIPRECATALYEALKYSLKL